MGTEPNQKRSDGIAPPAPSRRRHRPREETRALLLKAAAQLAIDRVAGTGKPHNLLADIKIRDVLAEVNRSHHNESGPRMTTGAFYQIWADQATFQYELLSYFVEQTALPGFDTVEAAVAKVIDEGASFDEVVRTLGRTDMVASRKAPEMYVTLGLGATAPIDLVRVVLFEQDRQYIEAFSRLFQQAMDHGQKRLRAGRTLEDLVWAIEALESGYLLRWRMRPEIPERRDANGIPAFESAFLGVVHGFVEDDA